MFWRKRWPKSEQAEFLIHLGEYLHEGYPLRLAIQLQLAGGKSASRTAAGRLTAALADGLSFYDALQRCGFPQETLSIIYFAEAGGDLAGGLTESGRMMLRKEAYKHQLERLARYPLLLIWMLAMMIFVIGTYLLPSFKRLYHELSIELPTSTRLLLNLTGNFPLLLTGLAVICMLLTLGYVTLRRLPHERRWRLLTRIPVAGLYVRCFLTQQFSFYTGSLLVSGLSMKQVCDTLSKNGTTDFLHNESEKIRCGLSDGRSLEKILADTDYYLPELLPVVRAGLINDKLGGTLSGYSLLVMNRMEERIRSAMAVFQPALLLFVGGMVLLLFTSVLLPIFQMANGL